MKSLRELFGPSKEEIWSQLGAEIGARYQEEGFFKSGKVVLTHRQWEILLDTYTVHSGSATITFTRIRAPYVNSDGFRFRVYRKSIFSPVGKFFGMQDIEIGDPYFDEEFIIQGTPEDMVMRMFANLNIRQLIQKQPNIHFEIKDDEGIFGTKFPDGVDELYFQTTGVIKEKQRLKDLFDLFTAVLEELCRLGSAYENNPGVKLK
ncbi:MAG: DUF3137 domain-containing protein [Ignavibacteriae bacterium]|nr:MAG: DUF3137 domain-containing protein [Ignavibacteriota bacterium]